jgi:hypothetical protein
MHRNHFAGIERRVGSNDERALPGGLGDVEFATISTVPRMILQVNFLNL